jgi:hypothetical protein
VVTVRFDGEKYGMFLRFIFGMVCRRQSMSDLAIMHLLKGRTALLELQTILAHGRLHGGNLSRCVQTQECNFRVDCPIRVFPNDYLA